MERVKAKKHLGQHFLRDQGKAMDIVDSYKNSFQNIKLLEVGPGMGVLTQYLLRRSDIDLSVVEIDKESVQYLNTHFPELQTKIYEEDFLKMNLNDSFLKGNSEHFGVIGNFPYNISSQIFFKILDYRFQCDEVVGMVQKEVGKRIASGPGNKDYGILSVLLQAFYDIEYCFTVLPSAFDPPPKVDSGVIRLTRNYNRNLDFEYEKFKTVVKVAFNQRRKMLGNALRPVTTRQDLPYLNLRAEQLDYKQFIELTKLIF